MECSICGISDRKRHVFYAVSPKGIILVCDKCASEEGFPMLKKLKAEPEDSAKGASVYERMKRLSGVALKEPEKPELEYQEKAIREVVNKNYEEKIRKQAITLKPRSDLIEHFDWIIMRVRRVKGLTQKQLAERIGESEAAIKMAEQGIVPEGYKLLDKLQDFLKIKLIKERKFYPSAEEKPTAARMLSIDKKALNSLTIADLQRMKEEREAREKEEKEHN